MASRVEAFRGRGFGKTGTGQAKVERVPGAGAKRRRIVKAVGTGAEALAAVVLRVPFAQETVKTPVAIDYTNNPFFRIDEFFSKLEQTGDADAVKKARNALRLTQYTTQPPPHRTVDKNYLIAKGATMGLFQGHPDAVDRIIKLMKRDGITLGEWSKENGDGMPSVKTNIAGIELKLSKSPADSKNPSGIGRLFLVFDEAAVRALKNSPKLPDPGLKPTNNFQGQGPEDPIELATLDTS